jgi:hypothetical protein
VAFSIVGDYLLRTGLHLRRQTQFIHGESIA